MPTLCDGTILPEKVVERRERDCVFVLSNTGKVNIVCNVMAILLFVFDELLFTFPLVAYIHNRPYLVFSLLFFSSFLVWCISSTTMCALLSCVIFTVFQNISSLCLLQFRSNSRRNPVSIYNNVPYEDGDLCQQQLNDVLNTAGDLDLSASLCK